MNIEELRRLKDSLEHRINYCPPDSAPLSAFTGTERSAQAAGDQYDELAPVFALLEELHRLEKRVARLERHDRFHDDQIIVAASLQETCPGSEHCEDFHEMGPGYCGSCEYREEEGPGDGATWRGPEPVY